MNEMIKFNEYLENKKKEYEINNSEFNIDFSCLMATNDWYGCTPVIKNEVLWFSKDDIQILDEKIEEYCSNYNKTDKEKLEYLLDKLNEQLPKTVKLLRKYIKKVKLEDIWLILFIHIYLVNLMNQQIKRYRHC